MPRLPAALRLLVLLAPVILMVFALSAARHMPHRDRPADVNTGSVMFSD